MKRIDGWKRVGAVFLLCAAMAIAAQAQTFTSLLAFDYSNGYNPAYMSLIQGADGALYGTTQLGGQLCCFDGTVFKINARGLTTMASFGGTGDEDEPLAGLVQGTDGSFYGTTSRGGNNLCICGNVFKITQDGTVTSLYNFSGLDGATPQGALIQATDGNFYGTTTFGGASNNACCGTVFKITSGGQLTTLYTFCASGNCVDGSEPFSGLVEGTDGNFYGTTYVGGGSSNCNVGCGTVFKITPGGALTTLYRFISGPDGGYPEGALVQATDGNFYGATLFTVFKITPQGILTTLHTFSGPDGNNLSAALVQATDGNFYGTTQYGGTNNYGTVFTITPGGTLTTLHDFDNTDGAIPYGGLVQDTNGRLYGTTYWGGQLGNPSCGNYPYRGCGTIYSLDMGLGPFVSLVRSPAKVEQTFGILGQGFTGTTSVSLNGTPASFTVRSGTLLTATVPNGATTGFVTVTTPSGTLTSNKPFRVTPQLLSFDPPSGPVGTQVTITGVSLTQTTGVGFGDYVPANFTVNSDTQVTATVPSGAKTGPVGIQTQGGIAISSGTFTVTP